MSFPSNVKVALGLYVDAVLDKISGIKKKPKNKQDKLTTALVLSGQIKHNVHDLIYLYGAVDSKGYRKIYIHIQMLHPFHHF